MADDMADPAPLPETEGTLEATTPPSSATRSSGEKITVNNRFDIDPSRPLSDFEHEMAEAYECTAFESGAADHIAFVMKGRAPVRLDVVSSMVNTEIGGLMTLRTATVIDWPQSESQRYALIYRRPGGNAILPRHLQRREPISEDVMRNGIIRPLFYALRDFADRGLFHGNIRPDNVFMTAHDNAEAMLGECASSIPGLIQPAVYETIERGMANKQGKGIGTVLDDIYSFGATIAVLARGNNPLEGRDSDSIIEEKIQRSSFAVLTDGLRLSPGLAEFLRATLNDDPRQRWTLEQVESWVDGTRTTSKPTSVTPKAQRAIDFNNKKYMRMRTLAKDLIHNIPEAVTLIESGHVGKWVERALMDQETADLVNAAISRAGVGGRTQGYEERLICFVSMALDPTAPIRYKDLRIFPSGIGYGMAYALNNGSPIQSYAEIIRDRFGWVWMSYKENSTTDPRHDGQQRLDQASKMIVRRGIDYGVERVLYELCPHVPCMSDMLVNRYTINCGFLLRGLDAVAAQHRSNRPIDRHIAAFIATRDNRDNTGFLSLLESGDNIRKSLALITLYQGIQKRYDCPKLISLCEWLSKDAETVAHRFRNQNLKQEIIRQIPKEVKTGSLSRLMALIDNPLQVRKDEYDFVQAGKTYVALNYEKEHIRRGLERDPEFGMGAGRHIALVIAVVLSGIMIASTIMMNFTGHGGY